MIHSHNDHLIIEITSHNSAGQYKCEADNGIDEKQFKVMTVNVNGMSVYEFCAQKLI